jgi:inorganic pyrophosphatase
VHEHQLVEIQEFFATYKRLESHKWTKVEGWRNAKEAMQIVNAAMNRYQELVKK